MRHLLLPLTAALTLATTPARSALEDIAAETPQNVVSPTTQRTDQTPPPAEPRKTRKTPKPTPVRFRVEIQGFAYKSSDISRPPVRKSLRTAVRTLRPLVARIPQDHKILVIGHADATGPEEPEGDKPGNIALSRQRAEAVRDAIAKQLNLNPERFEIVAKGSSEPKNRKNPKAASNRRVVVQYQP